MSIDEFLDRLDGVTPKGDGWMAKCPAHDDKNPSLSVNDGGDRILINCRAGCHYLNVLNAMGLEKADLYAEDKRNGEGREIVATYDYLDEAGQMLFQTIRFRPKDFRQRRPNSNGGWIYNLKGVRRVLYRLPEVAKAIASGRTVFIPEGEKDSDDLAQLGFIATCCPMGAGKWSDDYSQTLKGAKRIVVIADKDEPGRKHAAEVARSVARVVGCVKVLELPDGDGKPVKDASDWIAGGGTAAELKKIVESAENFDPSVKEVVEVEAEVTEGGGALSQPKKVKTQGKVVVMEDVESWPEPVATKDLLDSLSDEVNHCCSLPPHGDTIAALWTLFTYVFDSFDIAPMLRVTSPTKRCGKTTFLDFMQKVVRDPVAASNCTPAAMFRVIEQWHPTLLIDETDTFFRTNQELTGIVNSGHTKRMAFVLRTVGEGKNMEAARFSTWTPKLLAGIGKVTDTVEDRSITLEMKRKRSTVRLKRVGRFDSTEIRRKLARWATDNAARFARDDSEFSEIANDRANDNWTPLVAIASDAGPHWRQRAVEAAHSTDHGTDESNETYGIQLLTDLREVFNRQSNDRVTSAEIVQQLHAMEGRPWQEYGYKQREISANQMAKLLRPFTIFPKSIRLDDKTAKGYYVADFEDSFDTYLPSVTGSNRHTVTTPVNIGESDDFKPSHGSKVLRSEKCVSTNKDGHCYDVTVTRTDDQERQEVLSI